MTPRCRWAIVWAVLAAGASHGADPAVSFRLGAADARATPTKHGHAHTGGGNIDVRQPAPDTLLITVTGVAVAGGLPLCPSRATLETEVCQDFVIVFDKPDLADATLSLQGRVVGLLRNPCRGNAEMPHACARLSFLTDSQEVELATLCVPAQVASCKENRSIYAREGPMTVPVKPGRYRLRQTLGLLAAQSWRAVIPGHAAAAEFAPAPALNPTWIVYSDPFHGAAKKDFGFHVILKVAPAAAAADPAAP
ncbi:MAG: hypothetical protein NZ700_06900 [Gemmataceae bacterium]|nr:hypothetical protein [Gemmataceae bacterium]MDW8266938.1 hypothetical protein [Gemmataceae bacterium]